MMNSPDSIDSLIQQLKDQSSISVPRETSASITEENSIDFILKKASKTVDVVNSAVENLILTAEATGNPELITSIANLVNASASNIDAINKIVIQNKKTKTAIQIEKMRIEAKYEETAMNNATKLIATRADIMKQFLADLQKESPIVNVESQVIPVEPIEE